MQFAERMPASASAAGAGRYAPTPHTVPCPRSRRSRSCSWPPGAQRAEQDATAPRPDLQDPHRGAARGARARQGAGRGAGRGFVVRVSRRASRSLPTVMMGTSFFQGEYEAALTIYDEHVSPPLPQRAHPCGPSQKRRLPREHASRGRRGDFTPPREFLPEVVSSPRLG